MIKVNDMVKVADGSGSVTVNSRTGESEHSSIAISPKKAYKVLVIGGTYPTDRGICTDLPSNDVILWDEDTECLHFSQLCWLRKDQTEEALTCLAKLDKEVQDTILIIEAVERLTRLDLKKEVRNIWQTIRRIGQQIEDVKKLL